MTIISEIIRIRSDDCLFITTQKTINKYPSSLFYKLIKNGDESDFIYIDGNTLYIDMKPENVKCIINFMRGYNIENNSDSLKMDFSKLGLEFPKVNTELFIKSNKQYVDNLDSPYCIDNFTKSFFEKLSMPHNINSVTSLSELNEELNNEFNNNNKNMRIIRPRKEIIDSY